MRSVIPASLVAVLVGVASSAQAATVAVTIEQMKFMPAEITVPAGQYFLLGDNRDNSEDSRFIGTVPREKLIGRAHHVLVAADWLGGQRQPLSLVQAL